MCKRIFPEYLSDSSDIHENVSRIFPGSFQDFSNVSTCLDTSVIL